jgi:hypothetical protein
MRLLAAMVAGLAIAGCTQTPTAAVSPIASVPPTASASSGTATPAPQASPSPVIDLPLSKVSFACKLPVTMYASGGDYASYSGGFITFPEAGFQADPAGRIDSEYLAQDFATKSVPVLHGTTQAGAPFYDLSMKRWVPAGPGQSTPDGSAYAYSVVSSGSSPNPPLVIHVITVATGADRTFTVQRTPDFDGAMGLVVDDFDGAGVLFSSQATMGPPLGVWRLDIGSGTVRQISKELGVAGVGAGYLWLNRIDPRDPEGPATGHSGPRSNSVVRVDLSSGQETVWYFVAGHQVFFYGTDRLGAPIITDAPPPNFDHSALHLVSKPESSGITIYDGAGGIWLWAPQSDISGRLWLGSDRGIYLWTPAVGLQKVFSINRDPAFDHAVLPSGLCT